MTRSMAQALWLDRVCSPDRPELVLPTCSRVTLQSNPLQSNPVFLDPIHSTKAIPGVGSANLRKASFYFPTAPRCRSWKILYSLRDEGPADVSIYEEFWSSLAMSNPGIS